MTDMRTAKTVKRRELQAKCRAAQAIFKKRGVTDQEQDAIWEAVASVCVFQLEQGKGAIADYAKKLQG
jgi:hypothetical protein